MIQFSIRLPEDMYSAIKEAADKEHRSINAQIVKMLEDVTSCISGSIFKTEIPKS